MTEEATPERLAQRRDLVKEWLITARRSVLSFGRPNGSFLRDSRSTDNHLSSTTTARCYMALVYANRCERSDVRWEDSFRSYVSKLKIDWKGPVQIELSPSERDDDLNNFELAHLADLSFVADYVTHFDHDHDVVAAPALDDLPTRLKSHFDKRAQQRDRSKRLPMEGNDIGRHYFVNVHAARALAILGEKPPGWMLDSLLEITQYCIEQSFYAQRNVRHKLDSIQLVLAGVASAIYDVQSPPHVLEAVVDALHGSQLPEGNWPATHPLFLRKRKPWHITSHEIALCLTWLYHAPTIPHGTRRQLVAMMDQYFEQWVVRTYIPTVARADRTLSGWHDDHHIQEGYVVAWATAIVCHFLANYYWILCDALNQRVIESLQLEESSSYYLNESTAPEPRRKLRPTVGPAWPDLPPYAWDPKITVAQMASGIRNDWTDPSDGQAISTSIATKMLVPIVQNAGACPRKAHCALLLAGPPGTRKTSLVKVVAKTLGWALVSVPGSAILSEGWDRMEARATTVFRRVRLLTQCVLFFDEYEEFFRARGDDKEGEVTPIVGLDGRTIAAFITTGMLPRLQDLHDEGRCLIFLATNFPKRIDDAVRRTGRFDWIETIDHPQKDRAIAYATDSTTFTSKELLKRYAKKHVDSAAKGVRNAIEEIAKHAKPGTKVQFPFRKLEDALREGARASERGKSAKDAALPILKPEDKMDAPSLRD